MLSGIPLLSQAVVAPAYFAFMFLWGVAGWMFLPPQVSRIVALAGNSAPLALSLNASGLYLGTALGAVAGGLVIEHIGLGELGLVAAIFPLLALLVYAATRPRQVIVPRLG
jgi:predicted MFS family arabinose efflux permease